MSETSGRCRRTIDAIIADAIDRLAADVAAVRAKVDAISPEDFWRFVESERAWVAILEQDRDKMKDERNTAMMQREAAILQRDAAIRDHDAAIRDRDAAIHGRDAALADSAMLNAELAARPAANPPGISNSSPSAPQPAAPPAGWLTEEERKVIIWAASELSAIGHNRLSEDLRRLVKRHDAGSPPVVEVPVMVFGSGSWEMQKRYRAAMDRAGVQWKEVGRE